MKKILFILSAVIVFSACKKDDATNAEVTKDLTLANVAGSYKLTAATISSSGGSIDILSGTTYYSACEKDDITTFTTSGTYTITDAGTKCSPTTDDSGTYSVNATAKTITLDGTDIVNVTSLTNLKIVITETLSGFTYTYTYTRQ